MGETKSMTGEMPEEKRQSQARLKMKRFARNKSAVAGLIVFILILFAALTADLFFDFQEDVVRQRAAYRLQPPGPEFPLGTDHLGRNVLARIFFGATTSLGLSGAIVLTSLAVSTIIGSIAGYYGGKLDNVIMRIMDVFMAMPSILLAMAVVAALGTSRINLVLALSVSMIPGSTRFLRSLVLRLRNAEFVESAIAVGTSGPRILFKHIIPNAVAPVMINSTLAIGSMILSVSGLSFIGLGIQPPAPEWGAMLAQGREYILTAPHLILFPGIAILLAVLSTNLMADGLRDALDPRNR